MLVLDELELDLEFNDDKEEDVLESEDDGSSGELFEFSSIIVAFSKADNTSILSLKLSLSLISNNNDSPDLVV